jgi:hypothetical protein
MLVLRNPFRVFARPHHREAGVQIAGHG